MASLKLENIYKSFVKDQIVLDNISIDIKDGEFLVLVGPSGCGKSTLLRIIAGLEEPTSGNVIIGDRLVNNIHPKDRDIAMVFQNYALYPHMNVYDNLAFGLKLRKVDKSEIDERVKAAAKILEIEDLLARKPKALSGGQRQRVALGRSIVRDPKVFLFDEPLSNLDAKLRVQMRTEIKKLHKRLKTTMVYVTHDQVEAMTMGDRIIILKDGIIQQVGSPVEVYHNPVNMFVAGFIGAPAMNFIHGGIKDGMLVCDAFSIDLSESPETNKLEGQDVIFGIRPEDIHLDTNGLSLPLLVMEPLGNETLLHMEVGKTTIMAKVRSIDATKLEDDVSIRFDTKQICIFDKTSLERIL